MVGRREERQLALQYGMKMSNVGGTSVIKTLITYIGYVMAIIGFATVVWRVAVSFQKGTEHDTRVDEKLVQVVEFQKDQKQCMDSLTLRYEEIRQSVRDLNVLTYEILQKQNALRNSYVRYIQADERLTKEEFINYMEGVQWTIMPIKQDTMQYRISVKKIEK
jgi:hypothetical protein